MRINVVHAAPLTSNLISSTRISSKPDYSNYFLILFFSYHLFNFFEGAHGELALV
jgi:hypothetical protein